MKHQRSLPSTQHAQYLYTDFSIAATTQNNNKQSILKIIEYIKNVLKIRLYLSFRDIEEIYNKDAWFFNRIFNTDSAEEFWKKINQDNSQRLQQREIISLLTKIVLKLTNQKNCAAQDQKYQYFAELKTTIQWLHTKIVQIEKQIRDKIKQDAIHKRTQSQIKRKKQFDIEGQNLKQTISFNTSDIKQQIKYKHRDQKYLMEQNLEQKMHKQIYYHLLPSKKLNEAKDQALLAKLAPFKSEKKRPYESATLQKNLISTMEEGKTQIKQKLQQFKTNQRNKIKRKQKMQREGILSKLQNQNNLTLARLQLKKDELDKAERIKMQRMIKQSNKFTRQRLISLRNSLRAHSMRDESKQIKSIIKNHRETIQFVNNIEEIGNTKIHKDYQVPKYATLDLSSEWTKKQKQKRYADEMLQSKILRRIRNQSESKKYYDDLNRSEGRRSLVDLYDHELNEV